MPTFEYKARTPNLKITTGTIEANDEKEARNIVASLGLHPIEIKVKQKEEKGRGKINDRIRAMFAKELSVMIRSGLRTDDAIRVCQKQLKNPQFATVLDSVLVDVSSGLPLSEALARHPKVFDSVFINIVRSGEASGEMADALEMLAEFINRTNYIRGKLISALIYPCLILVFAVFSSLALLLFVFPQLEDLYAQLGGQLPIITQIFLTISHILRDYWFIWIPLVIGSIFLVYRWYKSPNGRYTVHRLILKIPFVGPFVQQIALTKFTKTLALLLDSGAKTVESLRIAGNSSGNALIERATQNLILGLQEGEKISQRMKADEALFTTLLVQVINVGEHTGHIVEMLKEVVQHYEKESDEMAARLGSVLDPILMVLMLAIVGTMLAALYLPVFNMSNLMQSF